MRKVDHIKGIHDARKTVHLFVEQGLEEDLLLFINDDRVAIAVVKSLRYFLHGSPSTRYCGYGKGVKVDGSIKHIQAGQIKGKTGEMRLVCKEIEIKANQLWFVIIIDWYKKNKELPKTVKRKLETDIQFREYEYEESKYPHRGDSR
ncbi:MAG: hypothetical protein R2787_04765 [Saprospiraceae bacterium]